jgi:putative DNA primase/helicase
MSDSLPAADIVVRLIKKVRDGSSSHEWFPCPGPHRVEAGAILEITAGTEKWDRPTLECKTSVGSSCTTQMILDAVGLTPDDLNPVAWWDRGPGPKLERNLSPKHLADLRASGLSDASITAGGFWTTDGRGLHAFLNIPGTHNIKDLGDCLVIPYRHPNGEENGYVRLKPDLPQTDDAGRARKYEAPWGRSPQPYLPAGLDAETLAYPSRPLLITEGEKKAAKAQEEGFPTIGLSGVWSWVAKRDRDEHDQPIGPRHLLPALEAVAWKGRTVYIIFDSDAARSPKVRSAEKALAQVLAEQGADVKVVRLPGGPEGAKVGLDDFLVAHGPDALRQLLDAADPAVSVVDPDLLDDPRRLAQRFLADRTFRYWQSGYYEYTGTHYVEIPEYEMRARLTNHCQAAIDSEYPKLVAAWQATAGEADRHNNNRKAGERPQARPKLRQRPRVTPQMVSSVMGHVNALAQLPSTTPLPCWLPDGSQPDLLAVQNGLLDPVRRELRPHGPDWFSTICLPYEYTEEADCPVFKAALDRSMSGDRERVRLLQQFFGLLLTRTTGPQRFLLLAGKAAGGKSTVAAGIKAMLGADNVSHVGLDEMAKDFGLAPLVGKAANIAADMSELDKVDEGRLKMLTSGDPVMVNRKHRPAIPAHLTARWILATNTVPRFSDKSEGIWRRMLLVPFTDAIPEDERVVGMDQPTFWAAEAPGLLRWALDGLAQLQEAGWRFAEPKASQEAKYQHRLESDPTRRFLEEAVVYDPDAPPLASIGLYQFYVTWMKLHGHTRPLADQGLVRAIEDVFPQASKKQATLPGIGRRMAWYGLQLTQNLPDEDEEQRAARVRLLPLAS